MFKLKLLFFFLACLFLMSQFSMVFALELKYPLIPGSQTPDEIINLSSDKQLPAYLNYYVRLFFIIAIGVAVALIIYGGIMYLLSGAWPGLALAAREKINQGLLGLFILVSFYLILGLINPQFLVFKISRPLPPEKIVFTPPPPPPGKASFYQIPIGATVDETLEKTTKLKTYGSEKEELTKIPSSFAMMFDMESRQNDSEKEELTKIPSSFAIAFAMESRQNDSEKEEFAKIDEIKDTSIVEEYEGEKVPEIAIPILNILGHLENVNDKIEKIMEEFKKCPCAEESTNILKGPQGYCYLKNIGGKLVPQGGHWCLQNISEFDDNKCDPECKTRCIDWAKPASLGFCQSDCRGKYPDLPPGATPWQNCVDHCQQDFVDEKCVCISYNHNLPTDSPDKTKWDNARWRQLKNICKSRQKKCGLDVCENKCNKEYDSCGNTGECRKALTDIKGYRQEIQKTLVQIDSLKTQLSIKQIELLNSTLAKNATDFLIQGIVDYNFQEDQSYLEEEIEEKNYEISYDRHKTLPQGEIPEVTLSPAGPDPLTLHAPKEGDIFSEEIVKENQRVWYESQRYSLFLVIHRLSLEELRDILGVCFSMAFGKTGFELDETTINKIIDEAFREGMSAFVADYLDPYTKDIAEAFEKKIRNEAGIKAGEKFKTECVRKCIEKCCKEKNSAIPDYDTCLMNSLYLDIFAQCDAKCRKECKDVPEKMARGLSKILMDILLKPVEGHLPQTIRDLLHKKVREIILKKETDEFLDKDLIDFLKDVDNEFLHRILTSQIKDLVPGLRKFMDKQLTDFLPQRLVGFLDNVDRMLKAVVDSLEGKMPERIKKYAEKLEKKLDKTAAELIGKLPGPTKVENLREKDCCERFPDYYYSDNKCREVTIEALNDVREWQRMGACAMSVSKPVPEPKKFCEDLGGVFNQKNSTEWNCYPGDTIPKEQWKEAFNFSRWGKNFSKNLFTALLNLPQQFFMALYETVKHCAVQYARVWIEDDIIIPLRPYIEQIKGLQKRLHEDLQATVGQAVPQQVQKLIEKDIDGALKQICEGFGGKDNCKNLGSVNREIKIKIGKEEVEVKYNEDEKIRQKTCEFVCGTYSLFHKDIFNQFSSEIKNALNKEVENLLGGKFRKIMKETLAAILWPEITNIEALIKGTPKQIICGELITDHQNNFGVKIGNQTTLKETCNNESKVRTAEATMGLLPYLNKESNFWKGLDGNDKEKYAYACPFIWYICQNPLSGWTKTIGCLTAEILETQCEMVNENTARHCSNPRQGNCETCKNKTANDSAYCEACDRLNKTLAYSIFKFGMEQIYQFESYTVKLTDDFSSDKSGYDELQRKKKEKAAYQWLYVAFDKEFSLSIPKCTSLGGNYSVSRKMRDETKKVALSRGFGQTEWDGLINGLENWTNLDELPDKTQAIAITFVSWLKNNTLYDILTNIPLGVLKPFKTGQPTLLREKDNTSSREFLAETPYQFLKKEVCGKIITDFNKDFPTSTIPAIMRGEYLKLGSRVNLPYSVESLTKPNRGQALQILLANPDPEISDKRKAQYLTCLSLDQAPSQLFGLDEALIYYLNPPEYRILFQLINDKLEPDERPSALNKLLDWLFNKTPVALLREIGKELEEKGKSEGKDIQNFAIFLETTMGQRVSQAIPNKKIIELIFEQLFDCCNEKETCPKNGLKGDLGGPYCPLHKKLSVKDWQELQEFLLHTPLELLKKYLNQQLLDNDWVNAEPIMDIFSKNSILGQPYFDTIGQWTRLDKAMEDVLMAKSDFDKVIDNAASSTIDLIQETFDKVLRQYPTQGVKYLAKQLGIGLGKNLATSTSEQLLGKCWKANEGDCTGPNQFYNKTTSECCRTGDALVCEGRCRPITENETCNGIEGEVKTKLTMPGSVAATGYCCYQNNCSICREATMDEVDENRCKRNPNKETFEQETEGGETISLCCLERKCEGQCEDFTKDTATGDYVVDAATGEFTLSSSGLADTCCVSIMDCMTNKFIFFLERMTEIFREGPLLNSLK